MTLVFTAGMARVAARAATLQLAPAVITIDPRPRVCEKGRITTRCSRRSWGKPWSFAADLGVIRTTEARDVLVDTMNELLQALPPSGEDSLRLRTGCERRAYDAPFREFTVAWGRPAEAEGCVLTLIRTLAAGFDLTAAGVWLRGRVILYLCWRGQTDGAGELLAGACSEDLVSGRFLRPSVMGRDHFLRVAASRNLDGAFWPRREWNEHAG
jgi:hypothetical protein